MEVVDPLSVLNMKRKERKIYNLPVSETFIFSENIEIREFFLIQVKIILILHTHNFLGLVFFEFI